MNQVYSGKTRCDSCLNNKKTLTFERGENKISLCKKCLENWAKQYK